jgi:hypothetical protein
MDIELARTFLAIVDAGTFARAAERLNVTQTTVSARVRSSSGRERVSARVCGAVGAEEGRRRGMAQRSMRRDQENQCATTRLERAALNWT